MMSSGEALFRRDDASALYRLENLSKSPDIFLARGSWDGTEDGVL